MKWLYRLLINWIDRLNEEAYKIGYSEGFAAGEEAMKNLIDKLTSPTISN